MDDRRPEGEEGPDIGGERLGDGDKTLADNEQTLGERDHTLRERDQATSEDDQAASDWDVDHGGDYAAHAGSTAARSQASPEREETSAPSDRTGQERDISAQRRDELSMLRDQIAQERERDTTATDAKDELSDGQTLSPEELLAHVRAIRIRAANDREQAARDREQARLDREQAAYDRERAGTDELTGVRRRGVGLEELENEIKRARREGHSLVAAYVDVDGLKSVNDEQGHAAGDELLRTVAELLRRHMRSYDLLVRLGGDEFLCAVPNITAAEARRRFDQLRSELSNFASSISVGFSELLDSDSPDEFIKRADSDLLASRKR